MEFPDASKMGLPQLLRYEACLRELQAEYYRGLIFDSLAEAADRHEARNPKPKPKSKAEPPGPSPIDLLNCKQLTGEQEQHMQSMQSAIRQAMRNGGKANATWISAIRSRYRATLPRQLAATGPDHPVTVHLKTCLEAMK